MTKASRALVCLLGLGLAQVCVLFLAARAFLPLPLPPAATDKYKRIPKADIQQKLVIVSDLSSHFGRDVATRLAELGFFVLGGVHLDSDRRAFTGYNAIKGVETFVLNIADPMDSVQMSYRVNQISQKYNRSLHGVVIVDTFGTSDESVPHEERRKQSKLRKKLSQASAGEGSNSLSNSSFTAHDREQLFHLNTRHAYDPLRVHSQYQHSFQGPFRLLQVCYDLASSVPSSGTARDFRVTFLRPAVVTSLLNRKGGLFSDDLISHSEAYLQSKDNDESAVAGLSSSLSLVEYGALPPSTFFTQPPPRRRSQSSVGTKSKKVPRRASSSVSSQGVSTTTTPSAVSPDDVTHSILHALTAHQPWAYYLLGGLKLNLTVEVEEASCLPWGEPTPTCDASAEYEQSTLLLSSLRHLFSMSRQLAAVAQTRAGSHIVMVPLKWVSFLAELFLPLAVAEYLWQEVVVPRVIAVL